MFLRTGLHLAALAAGAVGQLSTGTTPSLNLTAISAANGESTLECWQIGPFTASSVAGTVGSLALFLGQMANATFSALPARFDGGLHTAPAVQLVYFTSGLAHITLPNGTDEAWIQGGKYGLIIAADTPDKSKHGHRTQYPSDSDTIALQVPLKSACALNHTVLHSGPCTQTEANGL